MVKRVYEHSLVSFSQMKSRSRISLNALRTFEAAARHNSMTKASLELSVTPGAVSRQISELQSTLSFDLYEGPSNARTITADGLRLADTLTTALDQIESTLLTLDTARDRFIDVACLSTFAVKWLIPRLHRFREAHPDLELRLSTDAVVPDKFANRIDMSITILTPNDPQREQDTVLFEESLGPVFKPALLDSARDNRLNDLIEYPHLKSKTRPKVWKDWQLTAAETKKIDPVKESVFDHLSLAIEAAANGLGFCLSPKHLVESDIASGRLVAPFGFTETGYTYIVRTHGQHKTTCQTFIDWLCHESSASAT